MGALYNDRRDAGRALVKALAEVNETGRLDQVVLPIRRARVAT